MKTILKKGYYVVNATSLQIASGDGAIDTPDVAESMWHTISQTTPGGDKFFILWNPGDNFAWGE